MSTRPEPRAHILEIIKRDGPQNADQLAERLALSKTATRAHLVRLLDDGTIERLQEEATRPGRPTIRYTLSVEGDALFPTSDADILTELIRFLMTKDDASKLVEQFFTGMWTRRRDELHAALKAAGAPYDDAQRRETLLALLETHGFMPSLDHDQDSDAVELRACHCPFPAAVRATRIPCRLEAAFLAESLGRPLERSVWMDGKEERACVFRFGAREEHG